ncbi:unnamed protein product, partial [Mesorhabditis spiculigera]
MTSPRTREQPFVDYVVSMELPAPISSLKSPANILCPYAPYPISLPFINLEFSDWSPFPKDKPRFKGRPNYEIYKIYQRLHGVLIHLQSNSHSINDLNMERLFKDFTKGDFGFWRIFDGNWRKFPGYYLHMTSKKHEENELEKDGNAPVALPLDINSDDLLYINF